MVKENVSKKGKALSKSSKPRKDGKPKKDQGHEFRCVPKMVAGIFSECLDSNPEKRALVEEIGFGVLSNLLNYYLKQKVLKELFNCFDIYNNIIHMVAGEVEITTKKIRDALGLSSTGTPFPNKVVPKELSDEDYACFLLATSSANVTPRAYPTLYDVENTKQRNWALHVHIFLLEEIKKAKENNTKSVHGCCYAMLIIYFYETQFGKNSRDLIAQLSWIYWNGRTL
ncbi:hypothetical protein PIB30_047866 [Stylosanthes scabra]|uniref:Uncharacterized protein n=1 Tax=Stylosanthes scabra TaxID=79078 RepID=A0ABU6VF95_9FABA|nr:hypothetical protein [Stylosanthes scabra]